MNKVAKTLKRASIILLIIDSVSLLLLEIFLTFSDAEDIIFISVLIGGSFIISIKYLLFNALSTIIDLLDKIEKNTNNGKNYSLKETKNEINKKKSKQNQKIKKVYENTEDDEEDKDEERGYTELICPKCGYDLYFTEEDKEKICPHCGYKFNGEITK